MVSDDDHRWADFLTYVVGRPLLLVLWCLILWGTLYGAAFLFAAAVTGPTEAWQQAISGPDRLAAVVNVSLAFLSMIVWITVGVIAWRTRIRRRSSNRTVG